MPGIARVSAAALILTHVLVPPFSPSGRSFEIDRAHIRQLLDDGRYELAVPQAERLALSARSSAGAESLGALSAADLEVEARVLNGEGALSNTQARAEHIVMLKQRLLGPEHLEVATSVRNLGSVLIAAGDYERARQEFDRAVRIFERTDPTNAMRLADALHGLGDAEIRTEQYGAAERTLDRALGLRERALGPEHRLVAQTLERKGFLLLQRGSYGDARPLLMRALQISETHAASHADTAAVLDTLGSLCWFEGDVAGSERFYRRALQLAGQALAAGHPNAAFYQRDLAYSLRYLGRISEARDLQREALTTDRRARGDTHPEVAWDLNDLAGSQVEFGEYPEARRLYEEALAVIVTRYGPTHLNAATILHNLALLYASLGDSVEASRRLEQAVEIWQRVLGPSHPYVGRALDSLAAVFGDQGQYAEARALLERALRIRESSLGPNHRELAESLTSLAALFVRSGAASEAQRPLSRAMRIWEKTGSTNEPGYAAALALTGEVQVLQGKYDAAHQSFERAMTRRVSLGGPAHPVVSATKVGLASAMLGLGRYAEALRLALEAEDASRDHLRLTARYLSEHESLSYAATRRRGLDLALSAPAPRAGAATTALFDAVVRSRALVLDEMSERHATIRKTAGTGFDDLLASVVAARQRLGSLLVRGTSSSQPAGYRELLADARRELELAERKLAEQSAAFRTEIARQQVGREQVQRSLPEGAALVSFVRYHHATPWHAGSAGGPAYVAFVLTGDASPALLRLGPASDLEKLVQRWQAEVARGALRPDRRPAASEKAYRAAAARLRQRIWDPLVPFIGSRTRVFIVPDGALNLVSFASLPYGDDRYIVEEGPVLHYLAAERDLASASTEPPRQGTLLAIGGPDFDDPSGFVSTRDSRKEAPAPGNCVGLDSVKFQPLLATAHEIDDIAKIWARTVQTPANVLTGRAATEHALKQMAPEVGILHLATHGFFLGAGCAGPVSTTRGIGGLVGGASYGRSPLLLSGLALAGANHRNRETVGDDGILTAEEVAGLDLRQAQWVVLSACDTGIGEVRVGEGVLGLRRAFRIAGARTLIMSLWSVDDEATRAWMRVLYENRLAHHLDTAASARGADLTMLRNRRAAHESTHPFYWASFVAAGDWR